MITRIETDFGNISFDKPVKVYWDGDDLTVADANDATLLTVATSKVVNVSIERSSLTVPPRTDTITGTFGSLGEGKVLRFNGISRVKEEW